MKNGEIVTRFWEYYGGKPIDFGNDITLIAPYILMDVAYSSYRKHIEPINVTGRAKQIRGYWRKAYNQFNSQIFLPFKPEEYEDIVSLMDDIEEYLSGEVKDLEDAIVAYLDGKIEYDKDVVASALLTNILSQASNELICIASEGLSGQPAKSRELDAIRVWCIKFVNEFLPIEGTINTSEDEAVCNAVLALSNKIAQWIFKQ